MGESPTRSHVNRSADELLDDVFEEITAKVQAGEPVDIEEYARRLPEHAERIRSLCQAMQAMAMLGRSTSGTTSASSNSQPGGSLGQLGDFRILREVGRGGMGVVYEAEQISLGRRMALKVLPFAGILDERQLTRFRNEARAAASLDHPNIVHVHSVGCERAVHFYAMQFIEGHTLAQVIEQRRPSSPLPQAGEGPGVRGTAPTETFRTSPQPAPAESRSPDPAPQDFRSLVDFGSLPPPDPHPLAPDLSPADTNREPQAQVSTEKTPRASEFFRRVADWGIQAAEGLEHAHQLGVIHRDIKPSNLMVNSEGHLWITDFGLAQIQADAGITMTGDILGTLRYMSPEQAQGNRRAQDHRSDIYSLGVTLYELLALRSPFTSHDRHALMHEIVDGTPPPLRQLNRSIPRDLETIVLKALAAEPPARYATAQQMADELKRFLEHKPIRARRPTLLDRTTKWSRRHRPIVWSAAATVLLGVLALIVSTIVIARAYTREKQQRELADQQRARAEDRESELRHYLYAADLKLAHQAWKNAELPRALELLSRDVPGPGESDLRGFEWYYLRALCQQDRPTLFGHTGEIHCLTFSPDGKTLASASQDGTVKLWDVATEQLRRTLEVHAHEVNHVAFSPDGATLAATGDEGMVKLWKVATGKEKAVLKGHANDVFGIAFSPDGRLLATAGCDDDKAVKLWNAKTLREEAILRGHTGDVQSLAFAPDGKTLATVSSDKTLKLWDVASRKERATIDGHGKLTCVAFSRDGRKIATASQDRTVRLWRLADLSESRCFQGHTNWVHCVEFSPDGSLLASASRDGSVRIWGAATGELLNVLRGHTGRVWCAAFSPDGKTLATAGGDRTIRLWDPLARQDCQRGPAFSPPIGAIAFGQDDTLLICSGHQLVSWDPKKGPETSNAKELSDPALGAVFSPDRRTLATGTNEGHVKLWSVTDGTLLANLGRHEVSGRVSHLVFAPDGRTLATECESQIKVWDVPARRQRVAVRFEKAVSSVALGPDGRTLAVALNNGIVKLIDAQSGQERGTLHGGEDEGVLCLAFSPDGATLAAAGDDRVIRLWDLATARQRQTLVGHSDWVQSLAFTPDGKTLASAGRDGTLRFWSPVSGHELLSVETPIGMQHLVFSRDGKRLAGGGSLAGRGGEVYLWSAAGGIPGKPPAGKEEKKTR